MAPLLQRIKRRASARLERGGCDEQSTRFPVTCKIMGSYGVMMAKLQPELCGLCAYFTHLVLTKSFREGDLPHGFYWETVRPTDVYPVFNHYSSRLLLASSVDAGCPLCRAISHEIHRARPAVVSSAGANPSHHDAGAGERDDSVQILLAFNGSSTLQESDLSFLDERLWTFSIVTKNSFQEDSSPGRVVVKRHEVELVVADDEFDCLAHLPNFKNSWGTRKIPPLDPLSVDCLNQIQRWRKRCRESHLQCQRNDARLSSSTFTLPKRLLDVEAVFEESKPNGVRIVETAELCQNTVQDLSYVALSYCWGGWQGLVAKQNNIDALSRAVEEKLLPVTVRDAILVCRLLKIRYIWIDALCICQDDTEEWRHEAEHMADVYGGCEFALAASSSCYADEGFLKQRGFEPAKVATTFGTLHSKVEETKGIFVRRVPLDVSAQIKSSPLALRGWALQEWILAPAVLHFGSDQLMWECNSVCVESETGEETHAFPPVVRLSNRLGKHRFGFHGRPLWDAIVEEFTKRRLTRLADSIPAIAGLAKKLRALGVYDGGYVAGMWEDHLERQLLWHNDAHNLSPQQKSHNLPSWSWAHWNRPVRFPLIRDVIPQWNVRPRFESVPRDASRHLADACILGLNAITHRIDLGSLLVAYPLDQLGRTSWETNNGAVAIWLADEAPRDGGSYYSIRTCIQDWDSAAARDFTVYYLLVKKIHTAGHATADDPLVKNFKNLKLLEASWTCRRVGLLTLNVPCDKAASFLGDPYADLVSSHGSPFMTDGKEVEIKIV